MMGDEYERRYGKQFIPLMHCDAPERFRLAETIRLYPPGVRTIVVAGGFDDSRWPLLMDLEEACRELNESGIQVRAAVLATGISGEGFTRVSSCQYVDLKEDPGHTMLPSYLKGADVLFLPETFDEHLAHAYQYSISSKAHLFMFSRRPIVVYGHPLTGLVTYARGKQWSLVVDTRSTALLSAALRQLLTDDEKQEELIARANDVALSNHDCQAVRESFRSAVSGFVLRRAMPDR
jgi:glycosyltransferase involved in cell wall biosynthesis